MNKHTKFIDVITILTIIMIVLISVGLYLDFKEGINLLTDRKLMITTLIVFIVFTVEDLYNFIK